MPLIVKDYKWKQTENTLTIEVPLHGICQSKVDVFTSPRYLKASYPPNFFEVLLAYPINIEESECVLTETEIIFELCKAEVKEWEDLELSLSKQEKMRLKQQLVSEEHERFQKECHEKKERKCELKRVAVGEQIKLDTKQRKEIEEIKTEEKTKALGDVKSWTREFERKINKRALKYKKTSKPVERIPEKETESLPIPQIREVKSVEVSFTPRALPTPSRESRLEEENEWLRKQTEARRSVGFVSEDLRPEEKNPMYLKAKGDDFMKQKNYLGAISAYSFGITLSEKYADLYIGRSEAHILQGNVHKTIQDCSTALELMKPEVEANLDARATCIARRGVALFKIKRWRQAISELESAVRLKPENAEYRKSLEEARRGEEDSADSD